MSVWLALFLCAPATAAEVGKKGHRGLHLAETRPELPPPPVLFDEDDQAKLERGESVFHYEHVRGHDLAVAAVTTWADKWEVWRQIRKVDDYTDVLTGLRSAETISQSREGDYERIRVALDVDLSIPLIPTEVQIEALHYRDQGYLVYYQVDTPGRQALKHAIGYWSVTPMGNGRSLIVVMADVLPDFPMPVALREQIARSTVPLLAWNIARAAEGSVNDRERFMMSSEPESE